MARQFPGRGDPGCRERSRLTSVLVLWLARSRQHDAEFGELPGLGVYLDRPTMLFHDDVVAHGQPEPGAFAGRLGGEERVEHLLLHVRRNPGAVVRGCGSRRGRRDCASPR
jgi:hypothetical protein